ncbi:unknown [Firmicutes bacterium CAG:646]|nr:unknown [Firmicutes bacterium CAG:646]
MKLMKNFLIPTDQIRLSWKQISLFQTMNHTLPKFFLGGFRVFSQTHYLVQHHQRIFRKIIQKSYGIFVEIMNKAFCSCKMLKFPHLILNFFRHIFDPGCFFRLKFISQLLLQSFRFFLYGFQPCSDRLLIQNHFRSRINNNFFQIFNGTLTFHIKASDRVDLVSPQLDSPGIFLRKRKDIHNPAPDRKLSRHLHLRRPLISQLYQLRFHLIQRNFTVIVEMNGSVFP